MTLVTSVMVARILKRAFSVNLTLNVLIQTLFYCISIEEDKARSLRLEHAFSMEQFSKALRNLYGINFWTVTFSIIL